MLADIAVNIIAAAIYDIGKAVINKVSKTETVQRAINKVSVVKNLNDFPTRYMEAIVELHYAGKDATVLAFFREESIMQVFYNFYYGDARHSNNEQQISNSIAHCVEALSVGDDVKANNVNVADEVANFWKIFQQKVNDGRTVSEVEVKQKLIVTKNKI